MIRDHKHSLRKTHPSERKVSKHAPPRMCSVCGKPTPEYIETKGGGGKRQRTTCSKECLGVRTRMNLPKIRAKYLTNGR